MGSKVLLMKPFLVLKKVKLVDAEQSSNIELADSSKVELEVVGIIRHKILFKTRPKVISVSTSMLLLLLMTIESINDYWKWKLDYLFEVIVAEDCEILKGISMQNNLK